MAVCMTSWQRRKTFSFLPSDMKKSGLKSTVFPFVAAVGNLVLIAIRFFRMREPKKGSFAAA
jgi:hypothetical protein